MQMIRKTTAQVKNTSTRKPSSTTPQKNDGLNVEEFIKNFWNWLGENWMTYVGFVLVILWIIQLRQFIVGIAFLTFGILLIAGFFWDINKK